MEIEQSDALAELLATCRLYKPGDVVEIPRTLGDKLRRAGLILGEVAAAVVVDALFLPFVIMIGGTYLVFVELTGQRVDYGRLWQK